MQRRRVFIFLIGISVLLAVFTVATLPTNAQGILAIKYGDTVTGEVKSTKTGYAVFYSFTAKAGDAITATMTRTSGTLRPAVALADPSKTGNDFLMAEGELSDDGKASTIVTATIEKAGKYALIASRESYSNGTTTGKFSLTFDRASDEAATETPVPTKRAGATPTRKPTTKSTPTPVPIEGSTPEPSAGVDVFKVGTSPTYSVWSGNNLYVANFGDGTVSILDEDGNPTGSIQTGGVPFTLAWDGARLWVADLGTTDKPGNTVSVFDPKGKKLGSYKVGSQPFSMSYDADDKLMWVAIYGENKVVALDPKGKIVSTFDVTESGESGSNPNTVLWTGTELFVTLAGTDTNKGNTVLTLGSDGVMTGSFKVGQSPADLAWDDADQILYTANYDDDSVTALSAEGKTVGTYKVGKNPAALTWDGTHLWVSLAGENAVVALDKKGKVVAKAALSNSPNGITNDGMGHVWVALQGTNDSPGSEVIRITTETVLNQ